MTNNNNLIPKTEIVRELKSEIPSYEEFVNNYEVDKTVENSYHLENQAWNQEKSYGPGQSQSKEEVDKKIKDGFAVGLAGITYACPLVGAAASGATAIAGATTYVIGKITDDEDTATIGWDMTIIGATAGLGAATGSQGHNKISSICPK